MPRSSPIGRSLLLGVAALASLNLTSAARLDTSDDQSPYLHFPHPETRHDGAFSDPSSLLDFKNLVLLDEDWRQNPVPALNRHPHAKRQQHQPGRNYKRELVTEFDPPFPPGSCEQLSFKPMREWWIEGGRCGREDWANGAGKAKGGALGGRSKTNKLTVFRAMQISTSTT